MAETEVVWALRLIRGFFLFLSLAGIHLMPGNLFNDKQSPLAQPCKWLSLTLVRLGLSGVSILAITHWASLYSMFSLPVNRYFSSSIHFFRHLSVKWTLFIILIHLYRCRNEISQLIGNLVTFWLRMMKKKDTERRMLLSVSWRLAILIPLMLLQTSYFLCAWFDVYKKDPSLPPRLIPYSVAKSLGIPLVVQKIMTVIDTYSYEMQINGGKLAVAFMLSLICRILYDGVTLLNRHLLNLNRQAASILASQSITNGMVPSRPEALLPHLYATLELMCDLSRWIIQVNGSLSSVLFFIISADFIINVIDTAKVAIGWQTLEITDLYNWAVSWLPFIIIYTSAARLAIHTRQTERLIQKYNSTIDLVQDVYVSMASEFRSRENSLFRRRATSKLDRATTNLSRMSNAARLDDEAQGLQDESGMTGSDAFPLDEMDLLRVYNYSPILLNVGQCTPLREGFIFSFGSAIAIFTVMIMQLLPAQTTLDFD